MRPRLSTNATAILRRMVARGPAVERELTRAAGQVRVMLLAEDKRIISERIYSVPIPTTTRRKQKRSAAHPVFSVETHREFGYTYEARARPKKEKLWTRTGQLLNRERAFTRGPTIILANPQRYALARYRLGTTEGKQIRSPGVQSVQWQAEAIARKRDAILTLRRQALLRALTRP